MVKFYKPKTYKRKKRYYKCKIRKLQYSRPYSGLSQQIVPFTREDQKWGSLRSFQTNFGWTATNEALPAPQGSPVPGLVKTLVFQMSNLPGIADDIPKLFKVYRLNAVKVTFIPATTTTLATSTTGDLARNTALLIRIKKNQDGLLLDANNRVEMWNQNQAVKRIVLPFNKKFSIYMKVNQLSYKYRGPPPALPGYGITKPTWVTTDDREVDHYGMDVRIDTVNGDAIDTVFTTAPDYTIFTKYYFQCKGVI